MTVHFYNIVDLRCDGRSLVIGELAFEQVRNRGVIQADFRYTPDYLALPKARSIDPVNLPLTSAIHSFSHLPGALNDVLPDRWGKAVALRLNGIRSDDIAGLIDWLSGDHIGSLSFEPKNKPSKIRGLGPSYSALSALDQETKKLELQAEPVFKKEWALALASGSSVGGARRKTLIKRDGIGYLVKFRQKDDPVNYPRVEYATMTLASLAGIHASETSLVTINNSDALFVKRFDIEKDLQCRQILSFDTLLNGQARHYGELPQMMIQHISSHRLEEDLLQLFRQMCFNICIHNTDDHLKNFSLLRNDNGWFLSPAYDLVPGTAAGEYHQMGFGLSIVPPETEGLIELAKAFFHLNRAKAESAIHDCTAAIKQWQSHFISCGVSDDDIHFLSGIISKRIR